jgi:hypothetical protein
MTIERTNEREEKEILKRRRKELKVRSGYNKVSKREED